MKEKIALRTEIEGVIYLGRLVLAINTEEYPNDGVLVTAEDNSRLLEALATDAIAGFAIEL